MTGSKWIAAIAAGWLIQSNLPATAASLAQEDPRRDATVRVIEQVMPSVVNIRTRTVVPVQDPFEAGLRRFFGRQSTDTMISLGSGVIIDENGYLLTNDHVVRRAQQVGVQLNVGTNLYEAEIIASDPKRDVALLKLKSQPGEKFRAIRLAREDDLLLGETVLALGNPYGLGGSVSRGILSSKSRTVPQEGAPLVPGNWIQTDAPINHGNSGGPLVNLRGELIGLNVAVFNQTRDGEPVQGIGFAIPIRTVQEALGDILPISDVVKTYWFGARVRVGSYPLVFTSVQPDSPAEKAGIRVGDTVMQVNGIVPRTIFEFGDLLTAKPRSTVNLVLRRDGSLTEANVKLIPEAEVFNAEMIREKLGLKLQPISRGQEVAFLISDVDRRGPAAKAGLEPNMIVFTVDDQTPADILSFAKMLKDKHSGSKVLLSVLIPHRSGYYLRAIAEVTVRGN